MDSEWSSLVNVPAVPMAQAVPAEASVEGKRARALRLVLPLCLLAFLPLMLTSLLVMRGYTDELVFVDAAVAVTVLLCYSRRTWWSFCAFLFACGLMVLSIAQQSFNIGWDELIFLFRNGGVTEYRNWWMIVIVLAVFSIGVAFLIPAAAKRFGLRLRYGIGVVLFVAVLDHIAPNLYIGDLRFNLFSSAERNLFLGRSLSAGAVQFAPQVAYGTLKAALERNEKVVAIVVESLGVPSDDKVAAIVFAPLRHMKNYVVSQTFEHYHGATIHGELRVLCGLAANGKPTIGTILDSELMKNCLPNVFPGLPSMAYHGNVGTFYGRKVVYPSMGFKGAEFRKAFDESQRGCTSSYDAVCDAAVLQRIGERRDTPFQYFLTIDTHHPYSKRIDPTLTSHCSPDKLSRYWQDICATVAEFAQQLDRQDGPDLTVLVGDHAPPVVNDAAKNVVPVFTLRRRAGVPVSAASENKRAG